MSDNVCPVCGKDDQIQKVMSIVSNGIATSQFQIDGYGGRTGSSAAMTNLAARLRAPNPPKQSMTSLVFFFLAMLGLVPAACLTSPLITEGIANLRSGQVTFTFIVIVIEVIFIILGFVIYGREKAKHKAAEQAWAQHMAMTYAYLYYCFRDDRVFDPRNGRNVSPERLIELL